MVEDVVARASWGAAVLRPYMKFVQSAHDVIAAFSDKPGISSYDAVRDRLTLIRA